MSRTNGRSIKNRIGVVMNRLVGIGLKDSQQSIRPVLLWSQYIECGYTPPKVSYT